MMETKQTLQIFTEHFTQTENISASHATFSKTAHILDTVNLLADTRNIPFNLTTTILI